MMETKRKADGVVLMRKWNAALPPHPSRWSAVRFVSQMAYSKPRPLPSYRSRYNRLVPPYHIHVAHSRPIRIYNILVDWWQEATGNGGMSTMMRI